MDCERFERDDFIERYLAGTLGPDDRDRFEAHYFGCPECLDKLRAASLVMENLWEMGGRTASGARTPRLVPGRRRIWAYSAAAAALLAAVAALWWLAVRPGGAPGGRLDASATLAQLARFDPPPFVPLALRKAGNAAAERFAQGMKSYAGGLYEEAITDLQAAAELDPSEPSARFFLGICLLLTRKTDEGIRELERTIALGDSPYLEEAHFYQAKAFLAKGDVDGAKAELDWVAAKAGRLRDDAVGIRSLLR